MLEFLFFEMNVASRVFAMTCSVRRSNDIDMPRNLAKSVKVE